MPPEEATPVEEPTEAPPVEEATELPPAEKGEYTEKSAEEHRETRMVPQEALHAEREKRKSAQAKMRELEEQQKVLLSDLKQFTEKKEDVPAMDDYEKVLREQQREISSLKNEINSLKATDERSEQQRQQAEVEKKIETATQMLREKGIKPIKKWQSLVREELNDRLNEDPYDRDHADEVYRQANDPREWVKIYEEVIYPEVKGVAEPIIKAEKDVKKVELKKEAQLVGSPGKTVQKEQPKEEMSWDDYADWRRKNQVR